MQGYINNTMSSGSNSMLLAPLHGSNSLLQLPSSGTNLLLPESHGHASSSFTMGLPWETVVDYLPISSAWNMTPEQMANEHTRLVGNRNDRIRAANKRAREVEAQALAALEVRRMVME